MWIKYLWRVLIEETPKLFRVAVFFLVTLPHLLSAPLFGTILRGFGVTQPWEGIPLPWTIGFAAVVIAGVLVFALAKRAHRLDQQRTPRLKFRLSPNYGDTNPASNTEMRESEYTIYRVRIINDSDVTAEDVTVLLESVEGMAGRFHDLPAALYLGVDRKERITLHPAQEAYVNIAFFDGDLSENYKKNKLTFCTCNASLVLSVPVGAYEVSLKAFAHNTVACTSVVRISATWKKMNHLLNVEWLKGWELDDEIRKRIAQEKAKGDQ